MKDMAERLDVANEGGYRIPEAGLPKAGLDFGSIGKKEPKAVAKKAKPPVPDETGQLAQLADYISRTAPLVKPFAGAKKQLGDAVLPYWFEYNEGMKPEHVVTTLLVNGTEENSVDVSVVNRYSRKEHVPASVMSMFRHGYKFEIDGDKVPAGVAQSVIDELQKVLARHGCLEAMSVTSGYVACPEFHANRHCELTPELNMNLNAEIPAQVRVK